MNGDRDGNVSGDGDGDRAGTETVTGVEANEEVKDGNGDGCVDGARTGTEVETRGRTQDGNGDGNEDGIQEGGGEAKKRKKLHKNCRCDQTTLFRTRHHLCRQGVALAGTRQLRSQGLASVYYAHRTEGVTGSEGREGSNGVRSGIGVGGRNGDGNGGGGGNGDGDEAGTGTGTEVEANERVQDGNGDGNGDGAGTGTGMGVEIPWNDTGWEWGRERGRK